MFFIALTLAVLFPGVMALAAADQRRPDGRPPVVSAQGDSQGGPFALQSSPGNTLRMVGPLQIPTLDPALVRDLGTMFLARQMFAGLMRFDDDLNAVPALAESYEISDDGLTYRFVLAEGARFYSGATITASDVAFSLRRSLDPATAGGDASRLSGPTFLADIAGAESLLAGETDELAGVRALDERQLEIELVRPRSTFLLRLASVPASVIDANDLTLGSEWWQSPNSSGPFAVATYASDAELVLVPNEHFVLGMPTLDEVRIRTGTAAFGGLNLYETGQIDVIGVDSFNIERILDPQNPMSVDLVQSPLFAVEYIAFRTDSEPLDDPLIRRALGLAFPHESVARVSLNGRVEVADGLVPGGMLGVESWPVDRSYDLDAARVLIEQSRYGSADAVPPVRVFTAVPDRAESFRDVIERDLGIEVQVVVVDWLSYLNGLASKEFPSYLLYWGADYPDPETFLLTLFGSDAADNYVGFSNAQFDQLMLEASLEQDPASRVELYHRANQILIDEAVVIPLYNDVSYVLIRPWVEGLMVSPLGILYLDDVRVVS